MNNSYQMPCFKLYDIRGKVGKELNPEIAWRIGRAYAHYLRPIKVAIGGDVRLTTGTLKSALAEGLMDGGVDVVDLGLTGTEEIYYAAGFTDVDGGIAVTASHNPADYNGMKLVGKGAIPIGADNGLREIQRLAEQGFFSPVANKGNYTQSSYLEQYVDHLLTYVNLENFRPLRLVVNAGNGAAGHVIDAVEKMFIRHQVPVEFIKVHFSADGTFPHGVPNPLLPECRADTAKAVIAAGADMGIAWDCDFDRCFFFDEKGSFIEGYYIVGLLAEAFIKKNPGEKIIHDPRLVWNTQDIVSANGGQPVISKTGHTFIKQKMRSEDAIYGGEMSAHHYFRTFAYCDSGMIPWLLVAELLSTKQAKLSHVVGERIRHYPSSGEINMTLAHPARAIEKLKMLYLPEAINVDEIDGLSMMFADWRFNLRSSNTEPLVRLNVESRQHSEVMQQKTREIMALLTGFN